MKISATVVMAMPVRCAASLRLADKLLTSVGVSDPLSKLRGAPASHRLAAHPSGKAIR